MYSTAVMVLRRRIERRGRKKEKKRTLQGLLHMLGSLQIPAAFFYDFSSLLGYRRGRVGSRDFPFPL